MTRELEASLQRDVRSAGSLVEQFRSTRAQTFMAMARLLADAPKLKAAVDTDDPPTVQDNANDYQTQLNSHLLLVTNAAGRTAGSGSGLTTGCGKYTAGRISGWAGSCFVSGWVSSRVPSLLMVA